MLKTTILILLMMVFAVSAFADIPRPDRTPNRAKKSVEINTHLSIVLDRNAKEARLIIPRSQVNALRAELDGIDGGSEETMASSVSRLQLIVSGVFLSLAVAFAGLWFTRSGETSSKTGKAIVAGMVILAVGGLATIVYGNAGPPPAAREITGKMFSPALHLYKGGGGKIKLEVSDTDTIPRLIVPDPASTPVE